MTLVVLGLAQVLASASAVDRVTFAASAFIVVLGAIGVVVARNPVHAALMLVMTLFGVAVLFVEQQANFLAAVQVIVYAGAIVVLFLFVIMFLGVDREENVALEPLRSQRPLAVLFVLGGLAGILILGVGARWATGAHSVAGPAQGQSGGDVAALGRSVFTTYLFPFEATAALLVIAVVGAVVLARGARHAEDASRAQRMPSPSTRQEVSSTAQVADAVAAAVAAAVARHVSGDDQAEAPSVAASPTSSSRVPSASLEGEAEEEEEK